MKSRTKQISKNTSEAEIERVKLDLLSLVSHELRTPLTSVLNALRVINEDDELSKTERKKFLEMAYRNAERLNSTLSQLLDLSKLVSGRLVCRFHEVPLKQLLISLLERFDTEAENGGFKLTVDASTDLPIVLGDAPRIEQVVRSLFENATKFSPAGGKITLSIKTEVKRSSLHPRMQKLVGEGSRFVLLELTNSLAKMDMSGETSDVFKIFAQKEGILNRVYEGVGGSLAIGAEVLRQHGGALFAENEAMKFTAWMAIPILESEQALMKVLESRMYALRTEVGAVSLMILEVEHKSLNQVHEALKAALFRATDTVYSLARQDQIAVVMDDCKKADAPKIVRRLLKSMGAESGKFLKDKSAKVGLASGPDDTTDPEKLLSKARKSFVGLSEF